MTRPNFPVWSEFLLTVWRLAPIWLQVFQIQKRALAGGVGGAVRIPSPQTARNATDVEQEVHRKPAGSPQEARMAGRPFCDSTFSRPLPYNYCVESCSVPVTE